MPQEYALRRKSLFCISLNFATLKWKCIKRYPGSIVSVIISISIYGNVSVKKQSHISINKVIGLYKSASFNYTNMNNGFMV